MFGSTTIDPHERKRICKVSAPILMRMSRRRSQARDAQEDVCRLLFVVMGSSALGSTETEANVLKARDAYQLRARVSVFCGEEQEQSVQHIFFQT